MEVKQIADDLPLTGSRITLTSLTEQDIGKLESFFNDIASLKYYLPTTVRPFNRQQLYKLLSDWNDGETCFVFAVRSGGDLLGIVNIDDLDWTNSHAELGIALTDREARGKGYALEALSLLCDYAFNELGLHRVWSRIIDGNEASMKLFTAAGFEIEGRMRSHIRRGGIWLDMTIWGLIREA